MSRDSRADMSDIRFCRYGDRVLLLFSSTGNIEIFIESLVVMVKD